MNPRTETVGVSNLCNMLHPITLNTTPKTQTADASCSLAACTIENRLVITSFSHFTPSCPNNATASPCLCNLASAFRNFVPACTAPRFNCPRFFGKMACATSYAVKRYKWGRIADLSPNRLHNINVKYKTDGNAVTVPPTIELSLALMWETSRANISGPSAVSNDAW